MISEKVLQEKLEGFYSPVTRAGNHLLRCERTYRDKPYQIFYFDYSGDVANLDINRYTQSLFAKEYYRKPGPIQWNYYLAFLTDSVVPGERKAEIEKNERFARKFVIDTRELDTWLKACYFVPTATSEREEDLSSVWTRILDEAELECVYKEQIPLDKGVESIIRGDRIPHPASKSGKKLNPSEIKLPFLKRIDLSEFRPFPKTDEPITFSKVNLIEGANGFGKTSLLEGLEYFLTGKNNRDDVRTTARVLADFGEGFVENRHDYNLFRERDRAWYNSVTRIKGSNLNSNFSRFNFFNTDAAFKLANETGSEKEIEDAFREIALGDEVNLLARQIKRYSEKLNHELLRRVKDVNDVKEQLKELVDIEPEQAEESVSSLYAKTRELAGEINYSGIFPEDIPASLDSIFVSVAQAQNLLNEALAGIHWVPKLTIDRIIAEKHKLNTLLVNLRNLENILEQKRKAKVALTHEWKLKLDRLRLFEDLLPYFETGLATEIEGLGARIITNSAQLKKFRRLSDDFDSVKLLRTEPTPLELGLANTHFTATLEAERKELLALSAEIEAVKASQTHSENLLAQTKSAAFELLELNQSICRCPLCGNDYQVRDKLLDAIQKVTAAEFAASDRLTSLISKKSGLELVSRTTSELVSELVMLQTIIRGLDEFGGDFQVDRSVPVSQLVRRIGQVFKRITALETRLADLRDIQSTADSHQLSEKQYLKLIAQLERESVDVSGLTTESLRSSIAAQKHHLSGYDYKVGRLEVDIKQIDEKIRDLLDGIKDRVPSERAAEYSRRNDLVNDLANAFSETTFPAWMTVRSLSARLGEVELLIKSIQELLERDSLRKEIKKKNELQRKRFSGKLSKLGEERNRISAALSTLAYIESEFGEEAYLQEFLDQNREEIGRVFTAIHKPFEFTDFYMTDGAIRLKRKGGSTATMRSISTGQRAAIAISVFLTLNSSLKNGPPFLMFDDPISFVDDLNALSFLDYLRELAMSTKSPRQIFFATASEGLAFLFKKKFACIQDDLSCILLKRDS